MTNHVIDPSRSILVNCKNVVHFHFFQLREPSHKYELEYTAEKLWRFRQGYNTTGKRLADGYRHGADIWFVLHVSNHFIYTLSKVKKGFLILKAAYYS